jgi:hypothetical protein
MGEAISEEKQAEQKTEPQPVRREDVFTVKVYFVNPLDLIAVVMNTLVELEYETYSLPEYDSEKLLRILPKNRRSLVFVSVANRPETQRWLDFAQRAAAISGVQVGAFVYTSIEPMEKLKFLEAQVPAITFASIKSNTVKVMEQILTVFDARGTRRYVRVIARGITVAFFPIKGRDEPLRCDLVEISAQAFMCEVDPRWRHLFTVGSHFPDVQLALRGIRIRTAVRVLGFSREKKDVFILRFCGIELKGGKMEYTNKISGEVRQKVHSYVRSCLKEDLAEQLKKVTPEKT